MLPDFPEMKEKIFKDHFKRLNNRINGNMFPFNEISAHRMHEGHRHIIVREDGSEDEINIRKISAEMEISIKEFEKSSRAEVFKKLDGVAKEISMQKTKMILDELETATNKVGNSFDFSGKKLEPEDLFKLFEKIWLEFDENGKPIFQQIVAGEAAFKAITRVFEEIEKSDVFKSKFDKLIDKKREEWRDREANRKLVG